MERRSTGFFVKLLHSPKAWISAAVIGSVVVIALLAPVIAPHDPMKQDLADPLKPPVFFGGSAKHLFGTDLHGRDILSRTMYGARVSLSLGVLSVLLAAGVGVVAGMVSGFFGGRVDDIIMRAADVMLAFPPIVLAICIIALLKPSLSTVVIVLALVNWVWHARPIRSAVLRLRMLEYVSASRALGAPNLSILVRQIFPNVTPVIIVICTTQVGFMILLESALSFFGLTGTTLSWGWDIASGRDFVSVAWWMSTMPGLVLFLTVMSLNMLGDWVRDITDPKMRGDVVGR
jgi:peptide/nickel transport system permease protein